MEQFECCGNCRYWKSIFDYKRGLCHRNPPDFDGFPSTLAQDSCQNFSSAARPVSTVRDRILQRAH